MTPLSDLVHVTRQTTVLAFQFGDGISNIFMDLAADHYSVCSWRNVYINSPYNRLSVIYIRKLSLKLRYGKNKN